MPIAEEDGVGAEREAEAALRVEDDVEREQRQVERELRAADDGP